MSLCAVVSGAEDIEVIAAYRREKQAFLEGFLTLPYGIPSHDTFNRVFHHLDKKSFGKVLYDWSKALLEFLDFHQMAIDGKVMRARAQAGKKKAAYV
jgi:hypothetical protein